MDGEVKAPPEEKQRKIMRPEKAKKINTFVVVTETNLHNKLSRGYEFNRETKEYCKFKEKCKSCDSHTSSSANEKKEKTNTTSTTSTSSTTAIRPGAASNSSNEQSKGDAHFDEDWLSEKDNEMLGKLAFEETGHQRRVMRQREETLKRQQSNKVNMLSALRIQNTTRNSLDQLLQAALDKDLTSVNVNAFMIMDDGTFVPYIVSKECVGCNSLYEMCANKHIPIHIDRRQLFLDMMHHQEHFKELLHVFRYLDSPPEDRPWSKVKLPYLVYKRKIELLDGHLLDNLDFWQRVENLFEPNVEGFYYAIIVCFGLFSPENELM